MQAKPKQNTMIQSSPAPWFISTQGPTLQALSNKLLLTELIPSPVVSRFSLLRPPSPLLLMRCHACFGAECSAHPT
jgi:hypothetical protein